MSADHTILSEQEIGKRDDIRRDLLSDEEFYRNCAHYADWAFYTPPEQFLFHHYDEPPDDLLICHRPMVGMERYVVSDVRGGFYGIYDTRVVTKHIKTGTWIVVEDKGFFLRHELVEAEANVARLKEELCCQEKKHDE